MSTVEGNRRGVRRLTTETKHALKTTEFWVFVVILLALFIAGAVTGGDAGAATGGTAAEGGGDDLNAGRTWLYAIILTSAYLLSRGLAKSGAHDPYWDNANAGHGDGIGDRVKQAAQVLTDGQSGSAQTAGNQETTQQYR